MNIVSLRLVTPMRRSKWTTGGLLAATGLLTLLAPTPASAQTNLLTVNPGFEQGNQAPYHNYGYYADVLAGWNFFEDSYNGNQLNIESGDGTEGSRYFRMDRGGSLETNPGSRPSVTPGKVYELSFDSKKTRDEKTYTWRGMYAQVNFYDASGNLIKEVRGGEFQHSGTTGWRVIKVRATASAGAAKAGILVYHNAGTYASGPEDYNYDIGLRDFRVDNFRFAEVAEAGNLVYLRKAPRLLEKGKVVQVKLRHTAPGARRIIARLLNGSGGTVLTQTKDVAGAGRGIHTLNFTIPTTLAAANNYKWCVRMFNAGATWSNTYLSQSEITGAFCDDTVSGSGTVYPDNGKLVYEGRMLRGGTNGGSYADLYWPGTQIRTRFNGTKIVFRGDGSQDYLGNQAGMVAVIDGDFANQIKFTVGPGYREITIKEGLANTNHTICLYKNSSIEEKVVFKGFNLDAGKGLLSPELLSGRRIEFYGDSVTEGGVPDPNFAGANPDNDGEWSNNAARSYGILTGRELGMDTRLIAKGGMGMQAGFTPYHLYEKWNTVDGPGATTNDFGAWQPQAVVIAIGHNDQYGGQGGNPDEADFINRYRTQIQNLRNVYPNAHIFCMNTSITQLDFTSWEKSVVPLLDVGDDPKLHFQLYPWQNHSGHPRDYDMQGMATGNARFFSLSDWVEDTLIGIGADGGSGKSSDGGAGGVVNPPTGTIPIGLTISIKSLNNNFLWSTDYSLGTSEVRAGFATGPGTWERFRLDDAGGGQVALFSLQTQRYLTVDNNSATKFLRSDWATQIQGWERFAWESLGGNKFALKSAVTGKYVSCNRDDSGRIVAQWADTAQNWEQFEWQGL
ncbi:MAG: hypothetical protein H8F28_13785 [Fibrella sp.]|nr:hypothetical protein [Armatimonadota bacterium]